MKMIKRLFVGSIILLLLTTPLLVSAMVNEKTNTSSLNISGENSLGTVELKHQPLIRNLLGNKGLITEYFPPDDFEYEFPEDENGYVHMNFTLTVKHLLNPVPIYWAKWIFPKNYRWSGITLWINYDEQDYCYIRHTKVVRNATFEEYDILISGCTPLFTNGSNLTCLFWCISWPGITPLPKAHDLCEAYLADQVAVEDITIIPT